MPGKEHIVKPFKFKEQGDVIKKIKNGASISVPSRIRFREEDGFWLMNIRWANTIEISNEEAKFFVEKQKKEEKFTHQDFPFENSIKKLAGFICKDALVSDDIKIDVRKTGVNIDPAKLPNLEDREQILKSHPDLEL